MVKTSFGNENKMQLHATFTQHINKAMTREILLAKYLLKGGKDKNNCR